jgi:hypothetical protein
MKEQQYIEDLKDIKEIMNRSSKFISLSGMSGVFAGIFALLGTYAVHQAVFADQDFLGYGKAVITSGSLTTLLLIASATLILSVGTGIYFTTKETKKKKQRLWDHQTKRLLINLAIPLVTGGIFCLILLLKGYIGLVPPLTLIFYGLALINASKYTLSEVRSLGLFEVVLGLIATHFIGYGLLFWAIGFGLLHIIYGIIMQIRNKS